MTVPVAAWLFFRCLRWLLWIASAALYTEFYVHRSDHLDSFGHILPATEFLNLRFLSQPFSQASLN
jgi:hypothetical protein